MIFKIPYVQRANRQHEQSEGNFLDRTYLRDIYHKYHSWKLEEESTIVRNNISFKKYKKYKARTRMPPLKCNFTINLYVFHILHHVESFICIPMQGHKSTFLHNKADLWMIFTQRPSEHVLGYSNTQKRHFGYWNPTKTTPIN